MSEKIVQLNEEVIKGQLKELVRGSVEETLNELLEAEAEKLTQTAQDKRNEQRQGYCSGHYSRNRATYFRGCPPSRCQSSRDFFRGGYRRVVPPSGEQRRRGSH